MTNSRHTAIVSWQPTYTYATAAGARATSGGYFVASMPELAISATGASHSGAVINLMNLVAALPNSDNTPYGAIRHF
jgi:hypothetical protein